MRKLNNEIELKIGPLRKVVLFKNPGSEELEKEYEYLFGTAAIKKKFGKIKPEILGMVNDNIPLLKSGIAADKSIYILFNYLDNDNLMKVALSIRKLENIISLIAKVWKGNDNATSLSKSSQNMILYKNVMERIKRNNQGCDIRFWDYLAFRELNFHLY